MKIDPASQIEQAGNRYVCGYTADGAAWLGVQGDVSGFVGRRGEEGGFAWFPQTSENASVLRERLFWLTPTPLGMRKSFGFGDRLGLATPGHCAAVQGTGIAPVFAQQSVRENARTGRTPQQVLEDAMWGVFRSGWRAAWGADADHLKSPTDVAAFVDAGYSFFTIDPGEYVDAAGGMDDLDALRRKADGMNLQELVKAALENSPGWLEAREAVFLQAVVKYGRAILHTVEMFRTIERLKGKEGFDFEVSVDETVTPTTPEEHFFIAASLLRLGVRFTSLAPRFSGRFEKGVDYQGDLTQLAAELERHAAVVRHFGHYKLSLHSGSDKFSVYPLIARHFSERIHIKTAGTSYLEALRVLAKVEPDLFAEILTFAVARYEQDRQSYHVSAEVSKIPTASTKIDLGLLLEDFHARQVLHVTFGGVIEKFRGRIFPILMKASAAYHAGLEDHFRRHLQSFAQENHHG